MSEGLLLAALAIAALWLAVVSLICAVLLRQVAILSVRQANLTSAAAQPLEGPEAGAPAPERLRELIPAVSAGPALVLLTSATCGPCHELVRDLPSLAFAGSATLLLPGRASAAAPLAALVPSAFRVIRDPEAQELANLLRINRTPFAVVYRDGAVVAKGNTRDVASVANLLGTEGATDATRPALELEVASAD